MIQVAVCDDEAYMQEELSAIITAYFSARRLSVHIHKYADGESLLQDEQDFSIIFLDVQMGELNGLDTARELRRRKFGGILIFVTVLSEAVYDSFEVQAYDYLLKPIEKERFTRAMDRAVAAVSKNAVNLVVRKGNACQMIPQKDIRFCEVINRKVYVHTCNQGVVDYYDKIEDLEKKLDGQFFRCHRSYLINLGYVKGIQDKDAVLDTGERIPVSRVKYRALSDHVLQYMKKWGA